MKIADGLYWYSLWKPYRALFIRGYSCNVFAIKQKIDDEIWLIDAGSYAMGKLRLYLREMKKDGLDPSKITKIFITHAHPDHVTGLRKFLHLPNLKIYSHAADKKMLQNGYEEFWRNEFENMDSLSSEFYPINQKNMKFVSKYPMGNYSKLPESAIHILSDGQIIGGSNYDIQVVHTPGHTKGHLSYYIPQKKVLYCGDLMDPHMDHKPPLNFPSVSYSDFWDSLQKVKKLDVEIFCASHGKEIHFGLKYYQKFVAGVISNLEFAKSIVIDKLHTDFKGEMGVVLNDFVKSFPKRIWPKVEHKKLAYAVLRYLETKNVVTRKVNQWFLVEDVKN